MSNLKKVIFALLVVFGVSIIGCGNNNPVQNSAVNTVDVEKEAIQKEFQDGNTDYMFRLNGVSPANDAGFTLQFTPSSNNHPPVEDGKYVFLYNSKVILTLNGNSENTKYRGNYCSTGQHIFFVQSNINNPKPYLFINGAEIYINGFTGTNCSLLEKNGKIIIGSRTSTTNWKYCVLSVANPSDVKIYN